MENNSFGPAWDKHKAALQKEYPQLTNDDLAYEFGKEEQLLEHLQKKLGKTKSEIRDWLRLMG